MAVGEKTAEGRHHGAGGGQLEMTAGKIIGVQMIAGGGAATLSVVCGDRTTIPVGRGAEKTTAGHLGAKTAGAGE